MTGVWQRLRGATVARLTPDQKVACSNHVGVKTYFAPIFASMTLVGLNLSHSNVSPDFLIISYDMYFYAFDQIWDPKFPWVL